MNQKLLPGVFIGILLVVGLAVATSHSGGGGGGGGCCNHTINQVVVVEIAPLNISNSSAVCQQYPGCVETDGGLDYYKVGSVSGSFLAQPNNPNSLFCGQFTDTCASNTLLWDFVCGANVNIRGNFSHLAAAVLVDCASNGETCQNGACVGQLNPRILNLIPNVVSNHQQTNVQINGHSFDQNAIVQVDSVPYTPNLYTFINSTRIDLIVLQNTPARSYAITVMNPNNLTSNPAQLNVTTTHLACIANACIIVQGPGQNQCSAANATCNQTHFSCINNTCTQVPGPGPNQCVQNSTFCNFTGGGGNSTLPDLIVTYVRSPGGGCGGNNQTNTTCTITLEGGIKNIGISPVPWGSFANSFIDETNHVLISDLFIPILFPNATFNFTTSYGPITRGNYTISFNADSRNDVGETNENNNKLTTQVSV